VGVTNIPVPHVEGIHTDVPSRTADNLFWLGRYTERLEQTVRCARYVLGCVTEATEFSQNRVGQLRELLNRLGLLIPAEEGDPGEMLQQDLLGLIYDPECAGGVSDLLNRIHLSAFSVRDRLSSDTWHLLNRLRTYADRSPGGLPLSEAQRMLHALVLDLAAFSGMEMENMTRGHGWVFLDLGRRIERGVFVATLMAAVWRSGPGMERILEPALEIADSVMTHRRRYFAEPSLSSVMEVLVQDASNPRSLAFQLASLRHHAAGLPAGANPEGVSALVKQAGQLDEFLGKLGRCSPGDGTRLDAAEVLEAIAARLGALSELLSEVYFSHVLPRVS
jgi:uncharacterized alpha-E superfamily protein